jgi:hypothetical protein
MSAAAPTIPAPADLHGYIRGTAALLGLPLDDTQVHRVSEHLARTAAMARLLDEVDLAEHDEPAQLYVPAPWVDVDAVHDGRGGA